MSGTPRRSASPSAVRISFVAIKSVEQQAARGLERARELLVKQRTQLMNSVRSQLAEFGVVAAQGQRGFAALMMTLAEGHRSLPPVLVSALQALVQQIDSLKVAIAALEEQIMAVHGGRSPALVADITASPAHRCREGAVHPTSRSRNDRSPLAVTPLWCRAWMKPGLMNEAISPLAVTPGLVLNMPGNDEMREAFQPIGIRSSLE
jgi:hypothetical protein